MTKISHSPDTFDQYLGLMSAQNELIDNIKRMTASRIPIDPGVFLDEYISQAQSPIVWTPNIDRPALITNIMLSYTPVAAATLSIGQTAGTLRNIPIPTSNSSFPIDVTCAMIIKPGDVFTLTCSGATSIFLEIMGKLLDGTDWSLI